MAPFLRWIYTTSDGRALEPLPWDSALLFARWRLPFWARNAGRPAPWLATFAMLALFLGVAFQVRAVAALGAGGVVALALAFSSARQRVSALAVTAVKAPARVEARSKMTLEVTLRNHSRKPSGRVVLRIAPEWTAAREQYRVEASLKPYETRLCRFEMIAERGLGAYDLPRVELVAGDDAHLFPLCVAATTTMKLEVTEPGKVDAPVLAKAPFQHALQAIEVPMKGDEGTVRGLRPFQNGDGLRRIDWKRTARTQTLLVRDQDRLTSCDAAVIVDQFPDGHSGFETLSSLTAMRSAALALSRGLLSQRLALQLHGSEVHVPLASGTHQDLALEHSLMEVGLSRRLRFGELLQERLATLPPDSFAALLVCSAELADQSFWEGVLALESRRITPLLVLFDSVAFASAVSVEAGMEPSHWASVTHLRSRVEGDPSADLRRLAGRLADRALVIGPKDTLFEMRELLREGPSHAA